MDKFTKYLQYNQIEIFLNIWHGENNTYSLDLTDLMVIGGVDAYLFSILFCYLPAGREIKYQAHQWIRQPDADAKFPGKLYA